LINRHSLLFYNIKNIFVIMLMEFFTQPLSAIFFFVILISIVVFLHELGHYVAARLVGVKVETFSIGFGHELFGFDDKHGTRWKVCLVPLGGYVKMYGDADPASTPDIVSLRKMSKAQRRVSFYFKPLWAKFFVVIMGPLANYLTAFLIMAVMYVSFGKAHTVPEISGVQENSAASEAGLMLGDVIVKIDNEDINSFEDCKRIVMLSLGRELEMLIKRQGELMNLAIKPKVVKTKDFFGDEVQMPMLGIYSTIVEHVKMDIHSSIRQSLSDCYEISAATLMGVRQLIFMERSLDELGGPIRIAEYSSKSARLGFWGFMWFVAMISLNIGLINLLPIPMLDGGHLMLYCVEAVIGRPLSPVVLNTLFRAGFLLLVSLMIFATVNDILRFFH
jgi:regulator of sigma E protease